MLSPYSVVESVSPIHPVELPARDGGVVNLTELVEKNVPEAVSGHYYTNKYYIGSGDVQTVLAGQEYAEEYPVWYGRRFFVHDDGSQFSVDYCLDINSRSPENWSEDVKYIPEDDMPRLPLRTRILRPEEVDKLDSSLERRPLVISVHGLTGGSHENYIRAAFTEIHSIVPDAELVVITSRGCNRTKITTPQLFNACWTEDLRQLVKYVTQHQPQRPVFLQGFSLGASIIANYLGQEGTNIPSQVKSAIVVANPWDLKLCSVHLHSRLLGRKLYLKTMTSNLLRLVKNNRKVLSRDARYLATEPKLKTVKTMIDFDNLMTGPLFGFSGASEYYREASSVRRLKNISIPTLALSAKDDPVSGDLCVPYTEAQHNPHVYLSSTTHGGHLGWFGQTGPLWFATFIAKYLDAYLATVDMSKEPVRQPSDTNDFFKDGKFQVQTAGIVSKPLN